MLPRHTSELVHDSPQRPPSHHVPSQSFQPLQLTLGVERIFVHDMAVVAQPVTRPTQRVRPANTSPARAATKSKGMRAHSPRFLGLNRQWTDLGGHLPPSLDVLD